VLLLGSGMDSIELFASHPPTCCSSASGVGVKCGVVVIVLVVVNGSIMGGTDNG